MNPAAVMAATHGGKKQMREWLVIENSRAYSVFAPESIKKILGYIPRDVAEPLLGRKIESNVWFTREDGEKMRAHPEWKTSETDLWSPLGFWAA